VRLRLVKNFDSGFSSGSRFLVIICMNLNTHTVFLHLPCCHGYRYISLDAKGETLVVSVAEPHHFYAAPTPAPGTNFDAAPAPAPTLLYSKAKFLKRTKV
jgi:hypothetical protein